MTAKLINFGLSGKVFWNIILISIYMKTKEKVYIYSRRHTLSHLTK